MAIWASGAVTPDTEDEDATPADRWKRLAVDDVQNSNTQLEEGLALIGGGLLDAQPEPVPEPTFTLDETVQDVGLAAPSGFNDWLASAAGINNSLRGAVHDVLGMVPGEGRIEQGFKNVADAVLSVGPAKDTAWRAFNMLGIEKYEPKTASGRIAERAGWEVGMTLPFMLLGGATALARPAGASLDLAGQGVTQNVKMQVLKPFVESPAKAGIVELAAGGGAGVGGQVSQEIFGENLALDIAGQMIFGVATGGITGRMLRAGSGPREMQQLLDDASVGADKHLPGMTEAETAAAKAQGMFALREDRMAAQSMSDEFIEVNAESGIGPLFGSEEAMITFTRQLDEQFPGLDPISRTGQIDYVARRLSGEQPAPKTQSEATAKEYDQFLADSYEATAAPRKMLAPKNLKKIAATGRRGLLDRAANLNKQTLQDNGAAGVRAMSRFWMAKGGTPYASFRFRRARGDIFAGISKRNVSGMPSQQKDLNNLIINWRGIEASRVQKIKGDKPFLNIKGADGKGKVVSADTMRENIRVIEDRLGPEWTQNMRMRTARYFEAMQANVSRLEEEGVVTGAESVKLRSLIYSPKNFIEEVDPVLEIKTQGGGKLSVRSSGIRAMEGGGLDLIDVSAEDLLAQSIVRVENRIFRNRAAAAFHELATELPDNGVVALARPKGDGNAQRWVSLTAMVKGKAETFYMNPDVAPEFISSYPQDNAYRTISSMTGVRFGKAMITGANPAIAPVLFLRDMSFAIQTTGQYNRYFKPVGYGEMSLDIAQVSKDAWRREGRYEDYLKDGGGMNFLTHQGRIVDETTLTGRFQEVMHVLGYINETGEIMTRLAIRERALKNGLTAEQATFAARDYMDFAQGGEWSKAADAFVMYANAATLGWRNSARALKKDPAAYMAGVGNTMAMFTGLYWLNMQTNPEAVRDLSASQKANGAYIVTPVTRMDDKQNMRSTVIKLPVEHSMLPIKVLTDAILDKLVLGKDPDVATLDFLRASGNAASIGTLNSPFATMMLNFANYSTWTGDEIWSGADVPFGQEFKEYPDRATSDLARDMSTMMSKIPGLASSPITSPARLAAVSQTATGGNFYTQAMAGAYGAMRQVGPEVDMSWQAQAPLVPVVNRFVRETHPLGTQIENVERLEKEVNAPIVETKRVIDQQVAMLINNQPGAKPLKQIMKDVTTIAQSDKLGPPGMFTKQLQQRVQQSYQIAKLYAGQKAAIAPGSPSKSEVLSLMNQPAQVQARVVYGWLRDAEDDEKNGAARRRLLNQIRGTARAFTGENFQRSFQAIEAQEGKVKR